MLCELKIRCRKCGEDYALSDMPKDASGRFGVAPRCRKCRANKMSAYRSSIRGLKSPTPAEKQCSHCGETKCSSEFYRNSCRRDGISSHCKACDRNRMEGYKKPRLAVFTLAIPDHKTCPQCNQLLPSSSFSVDAKRKDGLNRYCRTCLGVRYAMSKYALTVEEATRLRNAKSCECCRKAISGSEVCIDHCHATGAVRGALCGACNFMLGAAKDRTEILRAGAEYLERKRQLKGFG